MLRSLQSLEIQAYLSTKERFGINTSTSGGWRRPISGGSSRISRSSQSKRDDHGIYILQGRATDKELSMQRPAMTWRRRGNMTPTRRRRRQQRRVLLASGVVTNQARRRFLSFVRFATICYCRQKATTSCGSEKATNTREITFIIQCPYRHNDSRSTP